MGVQGSHPSAFKGYRFGECPGCGKRGLYGGRIKNPQEPVQYVRCRLCYYEAFGIIAEHVAHDAGLTSI